MGVLRSGARALRRTRKLVRRRRIRFVRSTTKSSRHVRARLVRSAKKTAKQYERHGLPQLLGRRRLEREGALKAVEAFREQQPPEAIPPDYHDLAYLYAHVRQRHPQHVLEFGSGCSTAVLAAAVRANGSGHVWSLDADVGWAGVTRAALAPELAPHVTVVHAPAVEEDREVPGWRHRNVPDVEVDFLYLDSPPLTSERAVAFDPIDLEDRFRPGFTMVIDGRHRNARYLRQHLRRSYRVSRMTARYLFELNG